MIPDLEAVGSPAPAEMTGTPTPLRLRLDPNGPIEPYLDGAWWPRSHELPAELSAFLAALSADSVRSRSSAITATLGSLRPTVWSWQASRYTWLALAHPIDLR